MEMTGRWKLAQDHVQSGGLALAVLHSRPLREVVLSVQNYILHTHTKTSLCFACHVMNKHDGLQTKLQALSDLVTDKVSGVQPFLPARNDPSARCTPTGG